MNSTLGAKPLRLLLVTCVVATVFVVVIGGIGALTASPAVTVALPFGAAALSAAGLSFALPRINRLAQHAGQASAPRTARDVAAGTQGDSLEHTLYDLARVLAEGTRAQCAVVWLAVAEKLISAATYPLDADPEPRTTTLATLLAQPDVDHAVSVLDGPVLRAALTIGKPGRPVTPADQRLMQEIAQGALLLLRGAQLASELEEQVRQTDELGIKLQASRQRLTRARDIERHRLVSELTQVTTARLAALRGGVAEMHDLLSRSETNTEHIQRALARARAGLDELIDRFRIIARGVYPAVLRSQGPASALEELATDLPRPVRLSGRLPHRLSWEIESGIYWLAASAMQQLANRVTEAPLRAHLEHREHRLVVRIEDSAATVSVQEVHATLTDDIDRLTALGGDVEITEDSAGGIALRAWLPDRLEPSLDSLTPRPARQRP